MYHVKKLPDIYSDERVTDLLSVCYSSKFVIKSTVRKFLYKNISSKINYNVEDYSDNIIMDINDYLDYISEINRKFKFTEKSIILGGGYLESLNWINMESVANLDDAKKLLKEYTLNGFTKIYIETNLPLKKDKFNSDEMVSEITMLCKIVEFNYLRLKEKQEDAIHPVYIIGSKFSMDSISNRKNLNSNNLEIFLNTTQIFKDSFERFGIKNALRYIVEVMVQNQGNDYMDFIKNSKNTLYLSKTFNDGNDKVDIYSYNYIYGHLDRVVLYSMLFLEKLNLSKEDKLIFLYSAYMHDIGKINVSPEILLKKDKLTSYEWNELKKHPEYGLDVLKDVPGLDKLKKLVLHHHENYDGTGYPYGLKGTEIPYLARVLAITDSFDAMTTDRPYKKGKTYDEAIEELKRCSGTQFDPELVEQFIEVIKEKRELSDYAISYNNNFI